MSDFNSSLPIRTEAAGDVAAKIVDGTTPSQALAVDASGKITTKLNDGAGNSVTSQASGGQQALDVGINVAGVQVDPRDVRALTNADTVTVEQGAPALVANSWPVKITDGTDTLAISASGEASVTVTTALPAGTNNIGKVSIQDSSGTAFSVLNPLPVALASSPGDEIVNYNTAAAIAANATSNHDYTITSSKTFLLHKVLATASGKLKIEVQVSPDGSSFSTVLVGFNSTANPNIELDISSVTRVVSGAGSKIRVIRTNKDNQSQDVYSTIVGLEV